MLGTLAFSRARQESRALGSARAADWHGRGAARPRAEQRVRVIRYVFT